MNYLKCYSSLKRHILLLDAQNWYAVWEEKYIHTLLIALSPSIMQSEINDSKIWADLWYEAFLFVTELRHTTNDQRRKRSDYWWRSEVQETRYAHKTEWLWPAYSFWWRLYFSPYLADKAWQPNWAVFLHQYCKNICSAASPLVFELHCPPFVLLCCL